MEGELKHSQFEASLPLLSTQNAITPPMLQAATCVPTMIRNHRGDMTKPFMGTVPGNDVSRAPIEVKFFPVNKDSELLLGGVCCTEECWGDSGCDFEKIQQQLQNLPPSPSSNLTILPPEYATQPNENTACVVCRWLEAGPCAAEYKAWNEAMEIYTKEKDNDGRVFYSTANAMSACVRKYEYYDVYVAFL